MLTRQKKGIIQVLKLMFGHNVSVLYLDTIGPHDNEEAVLIKINGCGYEFGFDIATRLVINGMDVDKVIKHSVRSVASELALLLADSVINERGK